MTEPPSLHLTAMLTWRARCSSLAAQLVVLSAGAALLPIPDRWSYYGFVTLALLLPVLAVMALLTVYHMVRAGAEHGGRAYAVEHALLVAVPVSVAIVGLLFPFALTGVPYALAGALFLLALVGALVLPLLVRNDIDQGVAAWRKSTY